MFAITPIVLLVLALAGGGAAAVGNAHTKDNSAETVEVVFEACVEAQTQNTDQQAHDECDAASEQDLQAALDQ